jgi:hypothetical protein
MSQWTELDDQVLVTLVNAYVSTIAIFIVSWRIPKPYYK